MLLNNYQVTERQNRPGVLSNVALRALFINDGEYFDPYAISGVAIFSRADNLYPSSVLDANGEINVDVSGNIKMYFSNTNTTTTASDYDVSNYAPSSPHIFRTGAGRYICVLSPNNEPGTFNLSGLSELISNTVEQVGDYIDVWSVQLFDGEPIVTFLNDFTLNRGRFTVITEPLMVKVNSRISNNRIVLGSKIDIKVNNEINVENRNVTEEITNLFKDSIITDPAFEIVKLNQDRNLPARVTVSAFSDTSGSISVTSDNTVIFNWDTQALKSHPELLAGNLGSLTGAYEITMQFNILHERIKTIPMAVIVS